MNILLIPINIKKEKNLRKHLYLFKKRFYLCRYKLLKIEDNEKIIFSIRFSSSIISKLLQ
jgi:hypothetical protein